MSALPSSVVTIGDGEITITADLLAPKLGLSVEAESGDAPRLRLQCDRADDD